MKKGIHPEYNKVVFMDTTSGYKFICGSTKTSNETTNPTSTKPKKDVFDSQNDQVSIDGNEVKAGQELLYKVTYKNTTGKEQKDKKGTFIIQNKGCFILHTLES